MLEINADDMIVQAYLKGYGGTVDVIYTPTFLCFFEENDVAIIASPKLKSHYVGVLIIEYNI